MLLSYTELLNLVDTGVITNVNPEQVNAASIDLTLGRTVMRETVPPKDAYGWKNPVILRQKDNLSMQPVDAAGGIILHPGEFILAQSEQMFKLPNDISAEYKLKSSMARIGINHCLAGWCDAGWNGSVLTLELMNVTRHHNIKLRMGDPIGQMIFFRHTAVPADRSYAARGRYNGDTQVSQVKPDPNPAKGTTYDIEEN